MPEPSVPAQSADGQPRRAARVSLALLIGINLLNYIDRYVLSAIEPIVRDDLLSGDPNAKTKMGWLATAFLLTYMAASPIFGWLAEFMKRWAIIGVGVLLWSLATGACGLAQGFVMLLLCRVLVGVGEAAWGPVAPTVIADMYPPGKRGSVMAWFYVALPVGSALGFIIGGQVAAVMSWHWAFFVVTPPGIILGVWALLRPDPPRGGAVGGQEARPARRVRPADLRVLARTPSYVLNTLGMTLSTFAIGGMSFWMPTYVHQARLGVEGLSPEAALDQLAMVNRWFGAITVLAGLGGTIAGGYLSDWLHARLRRGGGGAWRGGAYFLVPGVSMLVAFPIFLGVLAAPFPLAWWLMFAAIFCIFLGTGPTNTIIANVTHPSMRATAFAVNIFLIHALGDAISPPLIGYIADTTGSMNRAFAVVGVTILLSGVVWIVAGPRLARDMEAAPHRLD